MLYQRKQPAQQLEMGSCQLCVPLSLLLSPLPSPITIHPSPVVLQFALEEPTDRLPWTTENMLDTEELSRSQVQLEWGRLSL